jgi:MFS family permease
VPAVPRVFRHRDFGLLWSGQTTSVVGDGIFSVALALETLRISNHASTLSYVLAARVAPNALLLLFAGALVDRLPRRLVVLGADLSRGLAIAALTGLVAAHALTVVELVVISIVVGVGDAFFYPAYMAIIPELLPSELLAQGNAFNSGSQTIGQAVAGPAIGGAVVAAFGASSAFAVDAASFLVSAGCLLAMRAVPRPASTGKSILADVHFGLRWTVRQRWLWYGILAASVANFAAFSPTGVLIPLIVRDGLHQGGRGVRAVFAVGGAGGAFAALAVGRFGTPVRRMTAIYLVWAIAAASLVGLGLAPDVFVVGAFGAIAFGGLVYGNLVWQTMSQQLIPGQMLGRVSSIDWLFSICLSPLGILVAGVLATTIGARDTMVAGALVSLAMAGVIFVPGVRDPDRPDYRSVPLDEPDVADGEAASVS